MGDTVVVGQNELSKTCMEGNVEKARELFVTEREFEIPLSWTDKEGKILTSPAMFIAIDYEHVDLVQYLIDNGASVNFKDGNDYTPLQWACFVGNVEIVRLLLSAGAVADEEAIDLAKEYGHTDIVSIISSCVDLYASLKSKDEIMEKACRHGDVSKVRELMEGGYDYNKWQDEDGSFYKYSPVFMALKFGHLDVVQLFSEKGATIDVDLKPEKEVAGEKAA